MRFEHPHLLSLLFGVVPALTAFFWWSWRERRRLIALFVQSRLLATLTVGVSATRLKARMALLVVSAGLLVVVLARPQWGFDWEEARRRGLDVVVAIDTSRSMLAEDVAPNRLARAKLAALDLKKLAKADRVGLVAFAGSAFLQCPLSFDDEAFRQSVNALDVTIIPQGGTAIAEAIESARAAFKEKNDNHKVLVLFTDGEDHDGQALETASAVAKDGMRIFTVGIGTANGELLRLTDSRGRVDYIKDDQGNAVKSRLNETLLQQVAQRTEGFYMHMSGANTMDLLYERGLAPLPKSEHSAKQIKRFHERYQWFLGLTIVLLLIEVILPDKKPGRPTAVAVNLSPRKELRMVMVWVFCMTLPWLGFASSSQALKKYESGKYESSLREYQRLLKEKPTEPRLQFNAGAAAFQAKAYENALEHFNASLVSDDLALQQRTYYNIGDTQFRIGEAEQELQKKQESWEQAVQSFESALKLNRQDADAQYNLDLVKRKLEELKKQQQQQQSKNDKQDPSKQDQQQSKNDPKQAEQKQEEKKPQPQKNQEPQQQNSPPQDEPPSEDKMAGVKMTPQQAQQLLDAIKGEEQPMIFKPQLKTNRTDRIFKDW